MKKEGERKIYKTSLLAVIFKITDAMTIIFKIMAIMTVMDRYFHFFLFRDHYDCYIENNTMATAVTVS